MSEMVECLTGALKAAGNRIRFYFLKKKKKESQFCTS